MISLNLLCLVCCSFLMHSGKAASFSPGVPAQQGCCSCSANVQDMLLLFTVQLHLTLCDPMDCSTPGFPVLHYLPEFAQTHVHWVDDAIQPSHPLSPASLPALNLSQHLCLFKWVSSSHHMAKGLEFSASTSVLPKNTQDWSPLGWTGWISLLSKELSRVLQHHSWKASILWCSAFFIVQLSHPYMTTGKTIALTRRTFVDKVMSLPINMRSKLVITFLPRSKRHLISWLQSPSAVILEPQNKVSHCFPIYLPWSDGTRCHDFSFLNVEF